tara:strand:- start:1419 stop:1706 length:288 start_codon:yes stop_codon:yes gene_type:complete
LSHCTTLTDSEKRDIYKGFGTLCSKAQEIFLKFPLVLKTDEVGAKNLFLSISDFQIPGNPKKSRGDFWDSRKLKIFGKPEMQSISQFTKNSKGIF